MNIVRSVIMLLFCFSYLHAGLSDISLLPVSLDGKIKLISVKDLKVGDELFTVDLEDEQETLKTVKITNITTIETKELTLVDVGHGMLSVGGDERFYNPKKKEWIDAKDLSTDDYLLDLNVEPIQIEEIERIQTEIKAVYYQISTEEPHCFFSCNNVGNSFLVHNFVRAVTENGNMIKEVAMVGQRILDTVSKVFKFGKRKCSHCDQKVQQNIPYHGEASNENYVLFVGQDGSVDIVSGFDDSQSEKEVRSGSWTGFQRTFNANGIGRSIF
jgi:hypothetical protein